MTDLIDRAEVLRVLERRVAEVAKTFEKQSSPKNRYMLGGASGELQAAAREIRAIPQADGVRQKPLLTWDELDGGCRVARTPFGKYAAWEDGRLTLPGEEGRWYEGGIKAAMVAAEHHARKTQDQET